MSEPFFKLQRAKEYKGRVKKLKRNAEKHVEKKMGGSLTTPTLSCHTHGSTCIPQRKPPLSTPSWVICCPQRSLYIIPSQVLSGSPIWSIRCSRSCGMSLLRQGFKGLSGFCLSLGLLAWGQSVAMLRGLLGKKLRPPHQRAMGCHPGIESSRPGQACRWLQPGWELKWDLRPRESLSQNHLDECSWLRSGVR